MDAECRKAFPSKNLNNTGSIFFDIYG